VSLDGPSERVAFPDEFGFSESITKRLAENSLADAQSPGTRREGTQMSDLTPTPPANPLAKGTTAYEDVQVGIVPEGPYHYEVLVKQAESDCATHAVEYVAINATTVRLDDPLWFDDVDLDVGVPGTQAGEIAWVWP
jgi:hypothetical protein